MKLKMKFTVSALTLLLVTLVNVQASEHGHGGRHSTNNEQVIEKLNLDDSTSKSLLELMNSHRSMHSAHESMSREQHHAVRDNHRKQVKNLLGDEKFSQFQSMMKSRHGKHEGNKCSKKRGMQHS